VLANVGEIGVEIRVERDNLGDVAVELLNKGHVFYHVVVHPRLLVLVHLLNQLPVSVQHRLHLPEPLVQGRPHLWVAVLRLLHFPVWLSGGRAHRGVGGGGVVAVVAAVVLLGAAVVGGVFHGGVCSGARWVHVLCMKQRDDSTKSCWVRHCKFFVTSRGTGQCYIYTALQGQTCYSSKLHRFQIKYVFLTRALFFLFTTIIWMFYHRYLIWVIWYCYKGIHLPVYFKLKLGQGWWKKYA